MSRLFLVIGYNAKTDVPGLVYLGRNGAEMDAATAAAPYQTIEKFLNPVGIRKNNSRAAANAAALAAAALAEDKEAVGLYEADLAAAFQRGAAAREEDLAQLRGEAAAALAASDKAHRAELAAVEKGYAAALAERDAEVKSLRAELKESKKKRGEPPPAEPSPP